MYPTATKIKNMCNKNVDDYAYVSGFAPICDKIQEMSNKNINTYPAVI